MKQKNCLLQVLPLTDVAKLLDKGALSGTASCAALHWPPHVFATHNFAHAIASSSNLVGYLRLPTAFLACEDGSLLLLSEREADRCAAALQRAEAGAVAAEDSGASKAVGIGGSTDLRHRPVLMLLAFARDVCPPLVSATPHPCADVGSLHSSAHLQVAAGVAALQLFAGETGLRRNTGRGYKHSSANQDALRAQLVRYVILGPQGWGEQRADGYAEGQKSAAVAVVSARNQAELWNESCLDHLCERALWHERDMDANERMHARM